MAKADDEQKVRAKKAAAKTPAAKKTEPKRAVARPVTRVVRRAPEARPERASEPAPKREGIVAKALPTAPEGHAPLIAPDGSLDGSLPLPLTFAKPGVPRGVLFQALVAQRANARQGNASTKNRSRVRGGGAKPWRQKGTGRARQGSTRAPHWRHGGVTFGPNGRRYAQRIPERMRKAAFAEAVSERAAMGRLLVVEGMKFAGARPRTREVVDWLASVGETGRVLLVAPEVYEGIDRAVANLKDVELRTPGTVRLVDVLGADTLLVMRPALDGLVKRATAVRA